MTTPTKRVMVRLAWFAAVAVSIGTLAGCGGDTAGDGTAVPTGEPISFEQLAAAAATSADATSGRFSFGLAVTMPGADEAFAFSGEGAFDTMSERALFSVDLSSFAALLGGLFAKLGAGSDATPDFGDPEKWKIDAVRDGSTTYLRLPAIADKLPEGKFWVRSPDGRASVAGLELGELGRFTDAEPGELLELLQGLTGDVATMGTETLRGVETTHYRAVLDPSSVAKSVPGADREDLRALADQLVAQSGISEVPLDIWVDANGLVRKFLLDVSATQPGDSEASRAKLTFELWDFGEEVEIELPPASQVADASVLGG